MTTSFADTFIADLKTKFKNKGTCVMVVPAVVENVAIQKYYDAGMEYMTKTMMVKGKDHGLEISWYAQEENGIVEYYVTGNEKFYEIYKTTELLKNYFMSCAVALNGVYSMKIDELQAKESAK